MEPSAPTPSAGNSPFLPDAVYRFAGHEMVIRSNSRTVLDYLMSLYDRFHVGERSAGSRKWDEHAPDAFVMTVIDRTSSSGEVCIEDRFGSAVLRCGSLSCFDAGDEESPEPSYSPLAYVQRSLLYRISLLAKDRLFIHGGALSFEGGAVVLPGASGTGKTTLCLKLVTQGFQLLSDEIVCVRPSHRIVEPFPRTVRFDESTRRLLDIPEEGLRRDHDAGRESVHWLLNPADTSPPGYGEPAKLRCVVFLQGLGDTPRLDSISPATALFALLKLSIRPPADPAAAIFGAASLLDGISCYNLVAGNLAETAALVSATVGRSAGRA